MKKFTKLAAVLAALVLALSCFVACSSDDDDDGGVTVLEGYWLAEDLSTGMYVVGNTMYDVEKKVYVADEGYPFSISGNKVVVLGETIFTFEISEDGKTLTVKGVYEGEEEVKTLILQKQSGTPTRA